MTGRPATPPLARGDYLIVTSGNHRLRMSTGEYRVTRVGPRWVHVVPLARFGAEHERLSEMSFWREDMAYGRPSDRVGNKSHAKTPEQAAYDDETAAAQHFLREVAGLDIRPGSPYRDRDMMVGLADLLAEVLPDSPAETDDE